MNAIDICARIETLERKISALIAMRRLDASDDAVINPTITALSNEIDDLRAALSAGGKP